MSIQIGKSTITQQERKYSQAKIAVGAAAPSALFHGGQEGQELAFILSSFYLSCLVKGQFPAL